MNKIFFFAAMLLFFSCQIIDAQDLQADSNQAVFVSSGFGFDYDPEDFESIDHFINTHGEPLKITGNSMPNIHDKIIDQMVILQYKNYAAGYYRFSKRETGSYPEAQLLFIASKDNIVYKFGIKHGMDVQQVLAIFPGTFVNNGSVWISGENGYTATISIQNNKVAGIVWNYSLE